MHRHFWFLGIVLAALAAVATPAQADEWSKTYSVTGRPQLMVDAGDGRVTILAGGQNQIAARVTTEGWRIGSQVHIDESQSGNTVQIRIRIPRQYFHLFVGRRSIHVDLTVPSAADLDIHTGDGSISTTAVSGHIRLDSGDGSISAQNLSGNLLLHSGDGSIEAEGLDGTLEASSGDGRIRVGGRFDSLRLKSGDGSIAAAVASGSKISSEWSLRTGDGSIRLRLPEGFAASLDAHTGDGRITLDFPVTVSGSLNPSSIQGKIGTGGGPLILRSGDGSIHLEKM
jgi:hypothetical protein